MTDIVNGQAPLTLGPSDKEKKYDRQLRLWATSGQQALEDAHICLINSGSGTVGIEALKNLVLPGIPYLRRRNLRAKLTKIPGIGSFTIIDDKEVEESDLGVNFFLDETCLGKSRAECCRDFLGELNPDVTGYWRDNFDSQSAFTLILYSLPIDDELLKTVKTYCQNLKVPLVSINCLGFYSYFNITFNRNFPIVDTHPESTATTDLRLLSPWPELSNFSERLTANIKNLSAHKHGHIPYVALILHYLEEWKAEHSGDVPLTYADKVKFRKLMAAGARTDSPEGAEENYDEATAAVLKSLLLPSLPKSVKEVFEYQPSQVSSLIRALQQVI
jgi:amyloid beta precursor protein binding protein 1